MPIIDDVTPNLGLPLPNADNFLADDVGRIRTSLTSLDAAVAAKANAASTTAALEAKADLVAGKVPAGQLPAYVDDVIEVANLASMPTTGEASKIYVTLDTNKQYRWSGSIYVEISASPGSTDAVPEGTTNKYFTNARALSAIPPADASTLGLVKIGAGLGIDAGGALFASAGAGSFMSILEIVPPSNGLASVTVPGGYVVGAILVGVDGVLLPPSDYTATNGTTIGFVGFVVGTANTVLVVKLSTITLGNLPAGSVTPAQLANSGSELGMRNRIINGDMRIGQRGISFSGITNSYALDRFLYSSATTAVVNITQSNDVPAGSGLQYSMRATIGTADTSIAADDHSVINQMIEGFNVADLVGVPITVSFWVKSSKTGTHCFRLRNAGGDKSYVTEYTVSASNTWEKKSITVPGGLITSGTWNFTNGVGLILSWVLATGSTYQTSTTSAWVNSNSFGTANQVNCLDGVGNVFAITGIQVEKGLVATPFDFRPYSVELAMCQRYFITFFMVIETGGLHQTVTFPVTMRTTPTISGAGASLTVNNLNNVSLSVYESARVGRVISLSAEL